VQLSRGAVVRALVVAAPWAWFLVRDTSVVMEIVAIVLPLLAIVAFEALVGFAILWRWLLAPAASVAVFGVVAVLGPWIPHDTGHPARGVTIAVANVLGHNDRADEVVDDILATHADIVVVPESTFAIHVRLAGRYDHAVRVPLFDVALGVYSNLPISASGNPPGLLDRARQARIEVDGPDGRFVLWALHLPKPWFASVGYQMRPGGHARKLDAYLDRFAAETLPVVVAGDTNLTDRGRGYRKMTARFDDALRGIWGGPTSLKRFLPPLFLRIDHIFMPEGWCADRAGRFDLTGSDHRGVHARVGPCRPD
jgi:endonuclease/exonuclease/phosphatase (EEP) superfamily protein YafD